jgi:hypothetical protein
LEKILEAWCKVATKLAKKDTMKSGMLLQPRNFSHMQILSWITDHKKKILTASESQQEAI